MAKINLKKENKWNEGNRERKNKFLVRCKIMPENPFQKETVLKMLSNIFFFLFNWNTCQWKTWQ